MRIRRSAIAACTVALASATVLPAAPSGAHSGGRAQLYVDAVRLEPQAGGWRASLVVRDADSGKLEPGFGVQVTGSGPGGHAVGPISLTDPDADGRYEGVMAMAEGLWALTVEAAEIPGGPRAVPFTRTWPVTLQAGQTLALGDSASPAPVGRSARRAPAVPLVLALVGVVTLATLAGLRLVRRRRAPSPERPGQAWA